MNWATLVFAVSLVLGTEMIARAIREIFEARMHLAALILFALFLLAVLIGKRLAYVREEMERRLAEAEVDAELRRLYVYQWCGLAEIPEPKR